MSYLIDKISYIYVAFRKKRTTFIKVIISFTIVLFLYLMVYLTIPIPPVHLLSSYIFSIVLIILATVIIHIFDSIFLKGSHKESFQTTDYYWIGISLIVLSSLTLLIILISYPDFYYFNVFYILLGTLLVSFIDKIFSRKEEEKKISKKSERIILAATNDIELNIGIAKSNLFNLEHIIEDAAPLEINHLNTNFWELISLNIADIEIENELLKNFSSIKKDIEFINKDISKIKLLTGKSPGIMKHEEEAYVKGLFQMAINLNGRMKQFIINSKLLNEKVERLYQNN